MELSPETSKICIKKRLSSVRLGIILNDMIDEFSEKRKVNLRDYPLWYNRPSRGYKKVRKFIEITNNSCGYFDSMPYQCPFIQRAKLLFEELLFDEIRYNITDEIYKLMRLHTISGKELWNKKRNKIGKYLNERIYNGYKKGITFLLLPHDIEHIIISYCI